jgi:hypothetical protein
MNMIDCLDHVWRYCSRISDDLELAHSGVILRHQRGTSKSGRKSRRPSSIKSDKQDKKKRGRSNSRGSGRGSKKKQRRVHFANDGRKHDTTEELEGSVDRLRDAWNLNLCACSAAKDQASSDDDADMDQAIAPAPPLTAKSLDRLLKAAKMPTSGSMEDKLSRLLGRLSSDSGSAAAGLERKSGEDIEVRSGVLHAAF